MTHRTVIAAFLMTTALTTVGFATDDPPARPRVRPGAGAGNGQGQAMVFKRLDANNDGKVSRSEFETLTQKLAERGKGKGQGQAMSGRLFEKLDTDNDGSLSAAEFARLQELRARLQGGEGRPGLGKRAGRRPGSNS